MRYCLNQKCEKNKYGSFFVESEKFCSSCGKEITDLRCECGESLALRDVFCSKCGQGVNRPESDEADEITKRNFPTPEELDMAADEEIGGHEADRSPKIQEDHE